MSIHRVSAVQSTPIAVKSFSLMESLHQILRDTMGGRLQWKHSQERQALGVLDVFTTVRQGLEVRIQALRAQAEQLPSVVHQWMVTLQWEERPGRKKQKVLDGQTLALPGKIQGEPKHNVLGNLFQAVYEQVADCVSAWVPLLNDLSKRLKDGSLHCSKTFIKPDARYGLPGGTIIQVGEGDRRVEIFLCGLAFPTVTIYTPAQKPIKLGQGHLHNLAFQEAVNTLISEVKHCRTDGR
jgi:hypothetical protein